MHAVCCGHPGVLLASGGGVPGVWHLVVAGAWQLRPAGARSAARRRPVLIHLAMRRFLCMNAACVKVTFAGQADGLTARYQRWSVPLAGLLSQIALELAGRAGTRLAGALGIAVHRGTLLRLVIDLPSPRSRRRRRCLASTTSRCAAGTSMPLSWPVPPPGGRSTFCPAARPGRWPTGSKPCTAPKLVACCLTSGFGE